MSKFVKGNDDQDDESWQVAHAHDAVKRLEPVDNRSLFEKLQEQKAAKEDALNEATKFSNLIRRLDNDEIDFLAGVKEEKERENEKRMRERDAAIDAFKQAQRKLDSLQETIRETVKSADETTIVSQKPTPAKRKHLSVTGVVKRERKKVQKDDPPVVVSTKVISSGKAGKDPIKPSLIDYASDSDG